MLKKLFLCVFMVMAVCCASAQDGDRRMAIYFNNPLSLVSKFRIKVEYRLDVQKSVLVNYTLHWGIFPGYSAGAEYRSYWETLGMNENYIYGRGGLGNVGYRRVPLINNQSDFAAPGNFFFGGAGVGRHWNMKGHLVLDASIGAKFTGVPTPEGDYNELLFYMTGPGAALEANFIFGFQF